MTANEFNRVLRDRKIPPLLLFYGEEGFLLEKAVRSVLDLTVPPEARDFNFQVFRGREILASAVYDAVNTLPVFSTKRMVLLKDVQDVPSGELEGLLPCLVPTEECVLLLTADKIDGRRKFFQEFKKKGALVEFKRLYDNQIPAFVREQARASGYTFTEEGLALFCRRVGSHLQEVHGELTKLFSYQGERQLIDAEDVAVIVSDTRVNSIFDLTNALGQGQGTQAIRVLERLLEEGVAPLVILSMLVRHFRQLWKIAELADRKEGKGGIAKKAGVNPYFLDGLIAQSRGFAPAQYRRIFERLLQADLSLKSSSLNPAAQLEKLIFDLLSLRTERAN